MTLISTSVKALLVLSMCFTGLAFAQDDGGMKDLEWFTSPNNIKFMEALAKQEGSKEAADALWAKYYSMVADSRAEVGHWHEPKDDE